MPTWGGGGSLISIPSVPVAPVSIEFVKRHLAAANANPFTGQQQIQDWGTEYMEASVMLPAMVQSVATNWITFLESLAGIVNVFQFSASFAAKYPESLTSDGSTQRVWRLKEPFPKWSIEKGSIYRLTFECREAI